MICQSGAFVCSLTNSSLFYWFFTFHIFFFFCSPMKLLLMKCVYRYNLRLMSFWVQKYFLFRCNFLGKQQKNQHQQQEQLQYFWFSHILWNHSYENSMWNMFLNHQQSQWKKKQPLWLLWIWMWQFFQRMFYSYFSNW